MLLIPLKIGSRGDQVINAKIFQQHGWAEVLDELSCTREDFVRTIRNILQSDPTHSLTNSTIPLKNKENFLQELASVVAVATTLASFI